MYPADQFAVRTFKIEADPEDAAGSEVLKNLSGRKLALLTWLNIKILKF